MYVFGYASEKAPIRTLKVNPRCIDVVVFVCIAQYISAISLQVRIHDALVMAGQRRHNERPTLRRPQLDFF